MSLTHTFADLSAKLPLERIAEACRRHGVSKLWVYGPDLSRQPAADDDICFLVDFLNNDFGPWGSKLDLLENDLSGPIHGKVRLASRGGIVDSTPSPFREEILNSALLIYES